MRLQGQVRGERDVVRGRPLVDELHPLAERRDLGLERTDLLSAGLEGGTHMMGWVYNPITT